LFLSLIIFYLYLTFAGKLQSRTSLGVIDHTIQIISKIDTKIKHKLPNIFSKISHLIKPNTVTRLQHHRIFPSHLSSPTVLPYAAATLTLPPSSLGGVTIRVLPPLKTSFL
jgi:hypothetical protein